MSLDDAKQCPWCARWCLKDAACAYVFACGLETTGTFHVGKGCGKSWCWTCGKSIVASIMTQKQVNGCQRLKIAMMQPAVRTNWVLKKRNTVAAVIQVIAGKDGVKGVT